MLKDIFSSSPLTRIVLDEKAYTVKHSVRKNMKRMVLRIENKGEIKLNSAKVSKRRLIEFIHENKRWIFDQEKRIKELSNEAKAFHYLAKAYTVLYHNKPLRLCDESVYINPLNEKEQCDRFYKTAAKKFLPERVEHWSEKMNVKYTSLGFRLAKKRWGSCNSAGRISFNPYMMKLAPEMIDYIIIHELSHLVHLNHSPAFYSHVERYMPDYLRVEKEIKEFSLQF